MNTLDIKLYGAARCHKTQFYIDHLNDEKLDFTFIDVEAKEENAEELRSLYKSGRLNFPTILIGDKRLRNPSLKKLTKYIAKMNDESGNELTSLIHDEKKRQFRLPIENEIGIVRYEKRDETFYLIHAEVPFALRGKGYGKVLVETTFEHIEKMGWKAVAICPYIKVVARRSDKWSKIIG